MIKYTLENMRKTFNGWTVLDKVTVPKGKDDKYQCRCKCGKEGAVLGYSLRAGKSKSCGCEQKIIISKLFSKHRATGTTEYIAWANMIQRCHNLNKPEYSDYGGRGIRVCSKWRTDFPAFLDHVGKRPSRKHSLDRINVNGNYEPGNVRWSTSKIQHANRRKLARIELFTDKELIDELRKRDYFVREL